MSHVLHTLTWLPTKTTTTGVYSFSAHGSRPLSAQSTIQSLEAGIPGGRRARPGPKGEPGAQETSPTHLGTSPLAHSSEPTLKKTTAFRLSSVPLSQGPITSRPGTENQAPKSHFTDFIYPKKYPELIHASKPPENLKTDQETGQLQLILETLESTLN